MVDAGIPKKPKNTIEEGSAIWTKTADEIAKVVKEYDNYLRILGKKSRLDQEQYKLSQRTLANLKRLRAEMIQQRKQGAGLAEVTKGLAAKFAGSGGAAGAVTKFTTGLAGLFSKVDEGTGLMKVFGKSTKITAGSFTGWVAGIQIAVGALVKLLDAQDKYRIKQAELIRNFGALANVNISAPYEAAAEGISIAGRTGGEAAKALQENLLKMRIPESQLKSIRASSGGGARGTGPLADLTRMTVGGLQKTPEYLMKLRTGFAQRDIFKLTNTIEEMGAVAHASGADMEQIADKILSVGMEFVGAGMKIDDAIMSVGQYADAVGKAELPMQMAADAMRNVQESFRTGAGADRLVTAAVFTNMNFTGLEKGVQEALNRVARKLHDKDYTQIDTMKQTGVLRRLGELGELDDVELDAFFKFFKQLESQLGGRYDAGGFMKQILAPQMAKLEMDALDETWQKQLGEGKSPELSPGAKYTAREIAFQAEEARGLTPDARGIEMLDATQAFKDFAAGTAALHKEWSSQAYEMLEDLSGMWGEFIAGMSSETTLILAGLQSNLRSIEEKLGPHSDELFKASGDSAQLDILRDVLTSDQYRSFLQNVISKQWQMSRSANLGGLGGNNRAIGIGLRGQRPPDFSDTTALMDQASRVLPADYTLSIPQKDGSIQYLKIHLTGEMIGIDNVIDSLHVLNSMDQAVSPVYNTPND